MNNDQPPEGNRDAGQRLRTWLSASYWGTLITTASFTLLVGFVAAVGFTLLLEYWSNQELLDRSSDDATKVLAAAITAVATALGVGIAIVEQARARRDSAIEEARAERDARIAEAAAAREEKRLLAEAATAVVNGISDETTSPVAGHLHLLIELGYHKAAVSLLDTYWDGKRIDHRAGVRLVDELLDDQPGKATTTYVRMADRAPADQAQTLPGRLVREWRDIKDLTSTQRARLLAASILQHRNQDPAFRLTDALVTISNAAKYHEKGCREEERAKFRRQVGRVLRRSGVDVLLRDDDLRRASLPRLRAKQVERLQEAASLEEGDHHLLLSRLDEAASMLRDDVEALLHP